MKSFIVIALADRLSVHRIQSKLDINSWVKILEQDSKKKKSRVVFMHLKIYPIAANHLVIENGTNSLFYLCNDLEFWSPKSIAAL